MGNLGIKHIAMLVIALALWVLAGTKKIRRCEMHVKANVTYPGRFPTSSRRFLYVRLSSGIPCDLQRLRAFNKAAVKTP